MVGPLQYLPHSENECVCSKDRLHGSGAYSYCEVFTTCMRYPYSQVTDYLSSSFPLHIKAPLCLSHLLIPAHISDKILTAKMKQVPKLTVMLVFSAIVPSFIKAQEKHVQPPVLAINQAVLTTPESAYEAACEPLNPNANAE